MLMNGCLACLFVGLLRCSPAESMDKALVREVRSAGHEYFGRHLPGFYENCRYFERFPSHPDGPAGEKVARVAIALWADGVSKLKDAFRVIDDAFELYKKECDAPKTFLGFTIPPPSSSREVFASSYDLPLVEGVRGKTHANDVRSRVTYLVVEGLLSLKALLEVISRKGEIPFCNINCYSEVKWDKMRIAGFVDENTAAWSSRRIKNLHRSIVRTITERMGVLRKKTASSKMYRECEWKTISNLLICPAAGKTGCLFKDLGETTAILANMVLYFDDDSKLSTSNPFCAASFAKRIEECRERTDSLYESCENRKAILATLKRDGGFGLCKCGCIPESTIYQFYPNRKIGIMDSPAKHMNMVIAVIDGARRGMLRRVLAARKAANPSSSNSGDSPGSEALVSALTTAGDVVREVTYCGAFLVGYPCGSIVAYCLWKFFHFYWLGLMEYRRVHPQR